MSQMTSRVACAMASPLVATSLLRPQSKTRREQSVIGSATNRESWKSLVIQQCISQASSCSQQAWASATARKVTT
jgi:hypothetical protein